MGSRDFIALKRQEPFRPFRVTLTDGHVYDVVHSEFVKVGADEMLIGLPRQGRVRPIAQHIVWINYPDIKQVDMLDADKALQTK